MTIHLRMANNAFNNSPSIQNEHRHTTLNVFSKTRVKMNKKYFHPFGSLVYVLTSALQTSSPFHKWKERSKIGIYLGLSPLHGKNVSLVFDQTMGLVSPQFHVLYDQQLDSVKQEALVSAWQDRASFLLKPEKDTAK
jgi:hypothetical protein